MKRLQVKPSTTRHPLRSYFTIVSLFLTYCYGFGLFTLGMPEAQAQESFNIPSKNVRWVESRSGNFPISLPWRFPEPLFSNPIKIADVALPKLSACYQSHLKPQRVSLFDRVGGVYREGLKLYYGGKFTLAYKYFEQITQKNKDSSWFIPASFWKASVLIRLKDEKEAQNVLLQVLESGNKNYGFQARCELVWANLQTSNFEQAISYVQQFQNDYESIEDKELMLFLEYYAYSRMKRNLKAEQILNRLVKEFTDSPQFLEHVLRLAEFYYRFQRWKELADLADSFIQQKKFHWNPETVRLLLMSAQSDLERGYWEEGEIRLKLLSNWKNEYHKIIRLFFFETYLRTHRWNKAMIEWSKLTGKDQDYSLRRLYYYALQAKQYELLSLPELSSYTSTWESKKRLMIAYSQYQLHSYQKSYRTYQKAQHAYKHTAPEQQSKQVQEEILFHLAVLELESGAFSDALKHLRLLITEHENSKQIQEYYFWYGLSLHELRKKRSLITLKQIDARSERGDDVLYLRSKINYEKKKWKLALRGFSSLIQRYPESEFLENTYLSQAELLYELERYESAQELLSQLKKNIDPVLDQVRFIRLRARLLNATERPQLAEELLRKGITEHRNYSLIQLRQKILHGMKQHRAILELTDEALTFNLKPSQKAMLEFYRANALYALKQYAEARKSYQKVLVQLPDQKRFTEYQLIQICYALRASEKEKQLFLTKARAFVSQPPQDILVNNTLLNLIRYYRLQNNTEEEDTYSRQLAQNYQRELKDLTLSAKERSARIVEIAKIYNSLSQYEKAEKLLEQADASSDKEQQLNIFKEQGTAMFQQKKYRKAVASYLKLLYFSTNISEKEKFELFKNLAYAYQQLKQEENAQSVYRKMLKELKTPELIEQAQKLFEQSTQATQTQK